MIWKELSVRKYLFTPY
jgi:hypothetical protein